MAASRAVATNAGSLSRWVTPGRVFLFALVLRVAFLTFAVSGPEGVTPAWSTGFEATNVAAKLVAGEGYSSPWKRSDPAAPTAVLPPGYPLIVAAAFAVFGSYSAAAAVVLLALNSLFSAAVSPLLLRIGEHLRMRALGVYAAIGWAVWMYTWEMSLKLWVTTLSTLLATAAVALHLSRGESKRMGDHVAIGLFWGFVALTNPALLVLLPFGVGVALVRRATRRLAIVSLALVFLVVLPWTVRNYARFGELVPVRDNFGLELYTGNNRVAARTGAILHPVVDANEHSDFLQIGETRYMRDRGAKAWQFIREEPVTFAQRTLRRISTFWFTPDPLPMVPLVIAAIVGLFMAVRRHGISVAMLAAAMLLFPATYYVTHSGHDYRHPIDPIVVLMAAYPIAAKRGTQSPS